jgi:hypothetical protein
LEGVVVLEEQADVICNIDLPELFTCPADTDLAGVVVSSEDTPCNLTVCPPDTDLAGHLLAVGTSTTEACNFNAEI